MNSKHLLLLAIICVSFFSCRKNLRDTDTNTEVVTDYLLSDKLSADLVYSTFSVLTGDTLYLGKNYTKSTSGSTITVAFDSAGCTDINGQLKKGNLKISQTSGSFWTSGNVITLECQQYSSNGILIDGTLTIKSNGLNNRSNPIYTVSCSGLKISSSTNPMYLNLNRSAEWLEGDSTLAITDDVFQFTGNSSGYLSKGTPFTSEIDSVCGIKAPCLFFSTGKTMLNPGNLSKRTLNWGNTINCNSSVSTSWADKEETISFP